MPNDSRTNEVFAFYPAAGYRTVGFMVIVSSLLLAAAVLFGGQTNRHGSPIPKELVWFCAPYFVIGLGLALYEWRVEISRGEMKMRVIRGFQPFVGTRSVELAGARRFVVGVSRGQRGPVVRVDLELADTGEVNRILLNADVRSFATVAEASNALQAPILLDGNASKLPDWLVKKGLPVVPD